GTQEYADEVFQSDTDKKLESIVCYYDAGNKDDCLLSDKELRYLIHSVSARRPRILTLFDCCHSAGIVRNALRIDTFKLVEKRIPYVFAKRNWEQFIFSSRLSREDVATLGEMTAIPEADFIHLSAC